MLIPALIGLAVCMALAATYFASRAVLKCVADMETAAGDEAAGDPAAAIAGVEPHAKLTVYQMQRRFSTFVQF